MTDENCSEIVGFQRESSFECALIRRGMILSALHCTSESKGCAASLVKILPGGIYDVDDFLGDADNLIIVAQEPVVGAAEARRWGRRSALAGLAENLR